MFTWPKALLLSAPSSDDLRNAVAVGVGSPRTRRIVDRRLQRVEQPRKADRRGLHVAAQRRLERGLAVAEQIVGDAEARREIVEVRHVGQRVEVPRADPRAARRILRPDLVVQVIPAQAGIHRHAA